jgi:hypothetical protein
VLKELERERLPEKIFWRVFSCGESCERQMVRFLERAGDKVVVVCERGAAAAAMTAAAAPAAAAAAAAAETAAAAAVAAAAEREQACVRCKQRYSTLGAAAAVGSADTVYPFIIILIQTPRPRR